MSTITLPNIRVSSDLTVKLKLKDGGVALDWSTLQNIKVSIFSDAQRAKGGNCGTTIDAEDPTLLVCTYAANKPQYLGVNRVIVTVKYMGETKTYDKPAFNFVRWTDDQAGEQITIEDPDVDVQICVEDISSSILQEAVDAAFTAADRANDAATAAEHMVDIHTGPEGKSAYEVAVEEGYTGTEEEWLASLVGPQGQQGIQGETGEAAGFGTVSAALQEDGGDPSVVVAASGPDTAKQFDFTFKNLKGEKGDKGDQGNSGYQGAAGELEVVNNLTDGGATKALSAEMGKTLEGEVSQLEHKVTGLATYDDSMAKLYDDKYVYFNGGNIYGDLTMAISGLITLLKDQTITVSIVTVPNNNMACISVANQDEQTFMAATGAKYLNGITTYTYTATADCKVAVSYVKTGGFTATVQTKGLEDRIEDLESATEDISEDLTAVEARVSELEIGVAKYIQNEHNLFDPLKVGRGYVSGGLIQRTSTGYICSGYQKLPETEWVEFDSLRSAVSETCLYSGELTDNETGAGLTVIGACSGTRFKRGTATYIAWTIAANATDEKVANYRNGNTIVNLQAGEIIRTYPSYSVKFAEKAKDIIGLGNPVLQGAFPVSKTGAKYAHDSSILVNSIGTKTYLYIVYQGNENNHGEFVSGQKIYLTVIDLVSGERIKDNVVILDIGVNGCTAIPVLPRLVKLPSGTVRIYYTADYIGRWLDLTDDFEGGSYGNTKVITMTSSSEWNESSVDLTVSNLVAHIEAATGLTPYKGSYAYMPILRGTDTPFLKDGKYYCTVELYMSNAGDYGSPMLAESVDCETWKLYPPVVVSDTELVNGAETAMAYDGTEFIAISRGSCYKVSRSADGMTWSEQVSSGYSNVGGNNCVRASVCKNSDTGDFVIAYEGNNVPGIATNQRKSVVVGLSKHLTKTLPLVKMVDLGYIHYPCIIYNRGFCFMSYTTKMGGGNSTDRDTVCLCKIDPLQE